MKKNPLLVLFISAISWSAMADQDIGSIRVDTPPNIDCLADDGVWANAPAATTRDAKAGIPIELRTVHTEDSIFFLVVFPDSTENRHHKRLIWNDDLKAYRSGPTREDSFVFKWSMEPLPIDLSLSGETPYKADVWYWKAKRTDPVGYADDKYHLYGKTKTKEAKALRSRSGQQMYLARLSDEGQSAYASQSYPQRLEREMPRYQNREPKGSRADIRAKGCWKDGHWTIEFARRLKTGNSDDVQFELDRSYQFGVSRFEIAGKPENPELEQPLYESGEVGEQLTLHWK